MNRLCAPLLTVLIILLGATPVWAEDLAELRQQVSDTEQAFADTMANRDFETFKTFLSPEAVFFAGDTPVSGKQAVAADWARYYESEVAPFSWKPQTVAVLESGTLALSSGPVFNAAGDRVGTFNSVWRREADGAWKVVFDKGGQYCPPPGGQSEEKPEEKPEEQEAE